MKLQDQLLHAHALITMCCDIIEQEQHSEAIALLGEIEQEDTKVFCIVQLILIACMSSKEHTGFVQKLVKYAEELDLEFGQKMRAFAQNLGKFLP